MTIQLDIFQEIQNIDTIVLRDFFLLPEINGDEFFIIFLLTKF